jgi:hypothetical protein
MRGICLPVCSTSWRHALLRAITSSHVAHSMAGELPTRARPTVRVLHIAYQMLHALHETCEDDTKQQLGACAYTIIS